MSQSDAVRTGSPAVASSYLPAAFFFLGYAKASMMYLFALKHVHHVYSRREENVDQEGREHAPLAEALFHSEPEISSSLRRRAGSPLRVILNSSTETPSGPTALTAFPFTNERMAPVLLEACSQATDQDLRRCSDQASVN